MLHGYVHPSFGLVAETLTKQIPEGPGGTALCVYHKGEKVIDVWGGTKDRDNNPWEEDTLALSYSTTKGVMSTLMHTLVDAGLADYDDPISKYWPEFAQNGKGRVTIRQAMCHEAGVYHIADMVEDATQMFDWEDMKARLAASEPVHTPGTAHGYHGITYGWLIGGIVEGITGRPFQEVLQEKISDPLGLDGLFIGLPEDQLHRRSKLVTRNGKTDTPKLPQNFIAYQTIMLIYNLFKILGVDFNQARLGLLPPSTKPLDWNGEDLVKAAIPGANGMFTARSLARMYAAIANGGELDGSRILSPERVQIMMQVQNRTRDRVIFLPMHWRLGYHRVFSARGKTSPEAFGHFGFGGSGAWCDPTYNLSVAMTLNSGVGTPMGDARIAFINGAVLKCAKRLAKNKVSINVPSTSDKTDNVVSLERSA